MLLAALAVDRLVGEYPVALHPVVWLGRAIAGAMKLAPAVGWWRQFGFGALLTLTLVAASAGLAVAALVLAARIPYLDVLVGAYLLKASFALRELEQASLRVQRPLREGDLEGARAVLSSLCSRDSANLDRDELLGATIESLAENTSDSFVAPLFYFVLLGVPGAFAYRAINTLDAMIGYHGPYEALGKFAARLDDVANWAPARLTAALLLLAGWLLRLDAPEGWRILRRDAGRTPSPNAGWPMAVMAGLLRVQLVKKDVYVLGDAQEMLSLEKVDVARLMVRMAGALMALTSIVAMLIRFIV